MKPFETTRLLKPLAELILEEPDWNDGATVSFYVPTLFDVSEHFEGISITVDDDDFINVYLEYSFQTDSYKLLVNYINYSGYGDGYSDFECKVVDIDKVTDKRIRAQLAENMDDLIEDVWVDLEDVPLDENEKLCEGCFIWEIGADKNEDVWPWFDKHHSKGVAWLVNEFERNE